MRLTNIYRAPSIQTLPSCENTNRSKSITRHLRTANINYNKQRKRKYPRKEE